jgi:hypothetical protein
MVFGTSRQAFALGRAGYLPLLLGEVHASRRTPVPALLLCSLITAGFVVANLWFKDAIDVAVLVSSLAALVWYILAMVCLFVLRRREPWLFTRYRAPLERTLPVAVVLLAGFSAWVYSADKVTVIYLTLVLYGVGLVYFGLWARGRLQKAAPEELAARKQRPHADEARPPRRGLLRAVSEGVTGVVLVLVLATVGWVVLVAYWPGTFGLAPTEVEVVAVLALLATALVLVSVVALMRTRS